MPLNDVGGQLFQKPSDHTVIILALGEAGDARMIGVKVGARKITESADGHGSDVRQQYIGAATRFGRAGQIGHAALRAGRQIGLKIRPFSRQRPRFSQAGIGRAQAQGFRLEGRRVQKRPVQNRLVFKHLGSPFRTGRFLRTARLARRGSGRVSGRGACRRPTSLPVRVACA